jgi:hypothetical protein
MVACVEVVVEVVVACVEVVVACVEVVVACIVLCRVALCNKHLNQHGINFFVIIGLKKGTRYVSLDDPPSSRAADSHDVIPELQCK